MEIKVYTIQVALPRWAKGALLAGAVALVGGIVVRAQNALRDSAAQAACERDGIPACRGDRAAGEAPRQGRIVWLERARRESR